MLLSAERISARILHVFGAFRVNLNLLLVTMLLCLGVSSFFKQSGAPHGHICMCTTFSLWSLLCCCRVNQCNFASRMLWGVLGYGSHPHVMQLLQPFHASAPWYSPFIKQHFASLQGISLTTLLSNPTFVSSFLQIC